MAAVDRVGEIKLEEGRMTQHADPFATRPTTSNLFIDGLLAVALIGNTSFGTPRIENITSIVAPEQPAIAMTIGASPSKVRHVEVAAPVSAVERKWFAFGYLEFDWDPRVPGGVPGFDSWPSS
jgi:hypothetical protein